MSDHADQVHAAITTAVGDGIPADRLATLLEDLDTSRFVTNDQVDATRIDSYTAQIGAAFGTPGAASKADNGDVEGRRFKPPGTGGQGRDRGTTKASNMDIGRAEAERRFGPRPGDAA